MTTQSNISLVGFMGTGKTAVGKSLAKRLNMQFKDMDEIIVQQAKKPISRIFEEDGEPHFRALEHQLIIDLSAQTGLIIGCGGGIVINPQNISTLSRTGLVVCLSAHPSVILRRVESDTSRPLLAGDDKMAKITTLLQKRQHLYDAIPCQVNTTELSLEQVVDAIITLQQQRTD